MTTLNKPEYFFQPVKAMRKLLRKKAPVVVTPWQTRLEINHHEIIGHCLIDTGIYDLALTEILWRLTNDGDYCIDAGANIGYTGSILSYKAGAKGRVLLFEPNPLLHDRVRNNISIYRYDNAELNTNALSSVNGISYLNIPESYSGNEGVASLTEKSGAGIEVHTIRLDDIVSENQHIAMLKIDVEGHEFSVLTGAEKLLDKKRISNIVFEEHAGYPAATTNFLEKKGYTIFKITKGFWGPVLRSPDYKSKADLLEAANYIATLEPDHVLAKINKPFYRCLVTRKKY